MSFGSFLRGIVSQVNPFDNGRTYGSYNPPQKKRPDQPVVVQPVIHSANLTNNIPTTHTPVSFGTLKINNVVVPPSKTYTDQNKPIPYKAVDVGAGVAANVASGFGEGISKLVGSPLSLASLIARKTGNPQVANNIDRANLPSRVGNSISGARKEVDVSAQNEGITKPYKVGSVVGSLGLGVPAVAEGVSKLGQVPKVVTNLPKTATVLRKVGKAGGGEILPKVRRFFRGNPAEDVVAGAGEVTQVPVTNASPGEVPIPVRKPNPIQITDVSGIDTPPPNVVKPPTPLIREVGGDANTAQNYVEQANKKAIDRFRAQVESQAKPSQKIEGVTALKKSDVTEARGVLDDALNTNKITPEEHAALNKELDNIEKPPTDGKPISVKQVDTIPVQQVNDVPVNTPEIPGKVRVTKTTDPVKAQTEAIAAQTPPNFVMQEGQGKTGGLPDMPKLSKAQVKSARNQRKLAKQLAKTKADTQAVIDNSPDIASKPEGSPGFVPTGEFRRGVNGNVSEVAHADTEAAQGARDIANLSAGDVLTQAQQDISQTGLLGVDSVRKLKAMLASGRYNQTSPEFRALSKVLYGGGSDYGRSLSLFDVTLRRNASGDQLANRFVSKLYGVAQDGSKLTEQDIATVQQAENNFTTARDAANQALDRYNATKTAGDFAAWKQAQQTADAAEKESLITEYRVANRVLKGNKDPNALKAIQEYKKSAGVYQMDWIDANMLSSTGTATRNLTNTALVRLENRLAHPFNRNYARGAKIGNEIGNRSVVSDFKARNELDQNVLSKAIGQWSTTANTLGEGNIRAVGTARAYKYYAKQLESQGVKGDQLQRDTEVMLHTDPDGIVQHYENWALSENALSGLAHSKKFEQQMVEWLAGNGHGALAQTAAKALVRLTVGFPTVIGRSLYGGVKRGTLGLPDLITAGKAFVKGDKQALSDALYAAKVHAGSGAVLYTLGTALAGAGIISPSYPSDPNERERWKAEGIQPNSIRIGGQWFSIPGYFGALALPLVIPANVINKTSPGDIAKGVLDGIADLAPTASLQQFVDGIEGRSGKQWLKNEITSLTRAATPVGSLLNEIAKMTDSTKNDTTTKDGINNLLDNIASGIPGLNNKVNTIPATDANGNVLGNPSAIATAFGAQGASQALGQQDVQQAQDTANQTYAQLKDWGVLDNKNLMGLVDKKTQAQIARGEDLKPEQITTIQKAVTKGIGTGISADSDSNWRENGDYGTDRTAMQVKMSMLEADPTAKKSEINNLKVQIARDNVLEQNQIPYDLLKFYEKTSQTDWGHMGNPKSDEYDPDTYNQLKQIDDLLTAAGGSYKEGDPTKNKFNSKGAGTGYSDKPPKMETSFGTLNTGGNPFAPKVREYQTADLSGTNGIPVINVVRPNIRHEIKVGQV